MSCTADTGLDTVADIRYEWQATFGSGGGRVTNRYGGTGSDFQTWEGTAAGSVDLLVKVWAPGEMEGGTNEHEVTVWPRDWRLQEQGAELQYAAPIPGAPGRWGRYRFSISRRLWVQAGTGPWAGSFMVAGTPRISDSEMYAHSDLVEGPPTYVLTDTICGVPPGLEVSVHALNSTCGNGTTLAKFNELVVKHENEHQSSLNQCIRSANSGRMAEIEALVGTDYGTVAEGLRSKWTNGLAIDLVKAGETPQRDQRSGPIWEHRGRGMWQYRSVELADYDGQTGC